MTSWMLVREIPLENSLIAQAPTQIIATIQPLKRITYME